MLDKLTLYVYARLTVYVIANSEYGPPGDLRLQEIDRPPLDEDGILVAVRAASVNPYDWHMMRGEPYLVRLGEGFRRPKRSVRGVDMAGRVEAVGANVTQAQPGDEVFGWGRWGALADYERAGEKSCAPKPAGISFEQAAAIPTAGCTALQGLRDVGGLQPGQRALVNGAAGGIGTFAVQIAKALGAEVTGVCSTRNVDLVRSLGADRVVDYTADDFARSGTRYDVVFDLVGNRSLRDLRRATTPKGTVVLCGGGDGKWIGPMLLPLRGLAVSKFVGQQLRWFLAQLNREDLLFMSDLVGDGKLAPVVDRTYPLREAPEAIAYLETGHARGKVVVTV
jgi:NADPH:quinone reductase-like Zn-dependent oxidoreductase